MDHADFKNTVQRKMLPYFIQEDTQGSNGWNLYNRDCEQIGAGPIKIDGRTLKALKRYVRLNEVDTLYFYGDSSQPFDGPNGNLNYLSALKLISKCVFLQNKEGK